MIWKLALPITVIAALLSPVGVWVSRGLDRDTLLWLFAAFLVFAALMMLFYRPKPRDAQFSTGTLLGIGGVVGGLAGFIGGLLGVGGGNIVVPALVALGVEPKKASQVPRSLSFLPPCRAFWGMSVWRQWITLCC